MSDTKEEFRPEIVLEYIYESNPAMTLHGALTDYVNDYMASLGRQEDDPRLKKGYMVKAYECVENDIFKHFGNKDGQIDWDEVSNIINPRLEEEILTWKKERHTEQTERRLANVSKYMSNNLLEVHEENGQSIASVKVIDSEIITGKSTDIAKALRNNEDIGWDFPRSRHVIFDAELIENIKNPKLQQVIWRDSEGEPHTLLFTDYAQASKWATELCEDLEGVERESVNWHPLDSKDANVMAWQKEISRGWNLLEKQTCSAPSLDEKTTEAKVAVGKMIVPNIEKPVGLDR